MEPGVQSEEVRLALRHIIKEEIQFFLVDSRNTWEDRYCGDIEFSVQGWRITFFNDCDELDYVDSVVAPDGRTGEFSEWSDQVEDGCNNPLDLLTREEHAKLEELLKKAKVKTNN